MKSIEYVLRHSALSPRRRFLSIYYLIGSSLLRPNRIRVPERDHTVITEGRMFMGHEQQESDLL
jgi:hypothetical protein